MIVATAGHIDHGKTTLVRALTGVDTDRLPEEKSRGISIDLGFAYWKAPSGQTIGFVDVPGHERFIRNMLAGVCGIDYAMLTVAADDGVMPQTIEHLNIIDLLQITRGVVVITKIDRVSAQRVAEVMQSVSALLSGTRLESSSLIAVSAVSGEGLDALRQELADASRSYAAREYDGRYFRYAVDRAFTRPGSGTIVTGTVFTGKAATGEKLLLSPSGVEARVRVIQKQGSQAQSAGAGERCALNLSGVDLDQVARGDWIVSPALHAPTQRLDVRLRVLDAEPKALKHWTPIHLHLATADVTARVAIRRGSAIAPGSSAIVQLISDRPLCALHGDRFIVRDQSATRTIGGGTVIDPFAPARRRSPEAHAAQLAALEHDDPAAALAALLAASPSGVDLGRFERSFNITAERIAALVRDCAAIVVEKDKRIALLQAEVERIKLAIIGALTKFHQQSPQALGAEIAALRENLAPALSAATFAALLRELVDERKIETSGSTARLPRHVTTANPADEKMWQSIKPLLDSAAFSVPSLRDLAAASKMKEAILKDFLHRKSRSGELIRVGADRFYPRATVAQLAATAQVVAQSVASGQFTAAQFRDRSGIGRSLAIEILECLDRLGITQRIGDARKMRRDFVPLLGPATAPAPPAAKPSIQPQKPQRTLHHPKH